MNSKKSINSFQMKEDRTPGYLSKIFCQFFNNFSALLLSKIYVIDIFNMVTYFQIFLTSRSTEILIVSNFWLGVYLRHSSRDRPSRDPNYFLFFPPHNIIY